MNEKASWGMGWAENHSSHAPVVLPNTLSLRV